MDEGKINPAEVAPEPVKPESPPEQVKPELPTEQKPELPPDQAKPEEPGFPVMDGERNPFENNGTGIPDLPVSTTPSANSKSETATKLGCVFGGALFSFLLSLYLIKRFKSDSSSEDKSLSIISDYETDEMPHPASFQMPESLLPITKWAAKLSKVINPGSNVAELSTIDLETATVFTYVEPESIRSSKVVATRETTMNRGAISLPSSSIGESTEMSDPYGLSKIK